MTENQEQEMYTVFADGREVCSGSAHLVAFVGAGLAARKRETVIRLPGGEFVELVHRDEADVEFASVEEIETYLRAQETSAHSE